VEPEAGKRQAGTIVAKLAGIDDRDAALALRGRAIWIDRSQLPEPGPGEYYWADLLGIRVETAEGRPLGVVAAMMETGANDVMVVAGEKERLIPFVPGKYVLTVDLEQQRLVVDWDPDF